MVCLTSFSKINLGLKIGAKRADGFHELRTVYQTLGLHDIVSVEVQPGSGTEIRCDDERVPCDESNTCHKVSERVLNASRTRCKAVITIEKHLAVQGGMGAASSNAVATMLALERALGIELAPAEKLRIAAEVGSDLPLFLIGGTVLGIGRGEEVYPLPDLPRMHVVVVTPSVGVSTPRAFVRWDELVPQNPALTAPGGAGTINEFSRRVFTWLNQSFPQACASGPASGVPAAGGDRAETLLLDLVRAGIENDFERVVFPEYPELREVKELLLREGARFASLSGSGSTVYGLFASEDGSQAAAGRMRAAGHTAVATTTLTREEYWKAMKAASSESRASS